MGIQRGPERETQLHTDAILRRPGVEGVSVTIRRHDLRWRIAEIKILGAGGSAPDTYAATLLMSKYWTLKVEAINAELAQAAAGASPPMGVMFRDRGAVVQQNRRLLLWLPVPQALASRLGARLAEVEVYEFFADSVLYGRVVEVRRRSRVRPARRWRGSFAAALRLSVPADVFVGWVGGQKLSWKQKLIVAAAMVSGVPGDVALVVRVLVQTMR